MSQPRLECHDLTKEYGSFSLGPLSLDLLPGTTCLVGPNGAGKSTFFKLIAKVETPTTGTATLSDGANGLGYLPQEPALPGNARCEDFLHHVAWIQQVPSRSRNEAVANALAQVGLSDRKKSKIKTLSGGMRRRLGIAHALVHEPKILLLDEPTVGLDPKQRIAVRKTISEICQGRIVIVSTHLVEDVRALADRVVILNGGRVAYDGNIEQLERTVPEADTAESRLERAIAEMLDGEPE